MDKVFCQMKPEPKTQAIDTQLKNIFGVDRQESIRKNKCVACDQTVYPETMADIDQREFKISGICPGCWKKIFLP